MNFTPKSIIPFKINKEQALEAYSEYIEKAEAVPSAFTVKNAGMHIKQTYVPIYLTNAKAEVNIAFETSRFREGKSVDYRLERSAKVDINDLAVGGSPYIPNDAFECLGDYDYKKAIKYDLNVTAGTVVSDCTYSEKMVNDIIDDAITTSAEDAILDTIKEHGTTYVDESDVNVLSKETECMLVPVWIIQIPKKRYTYNILINGETGKVTGELPPFSRKYWTRFAIIGLIVATLIFLGTYFTSTASAATRDPEIKAEVDLHNENRVIDNAGLLTQKEIEGLNYWIDKDSSDYLVDFVILLENSISDRIEKHGKFFLAENDYGIGENDDALLFLYNVGKREATIVMVGYPEECINEYGLQYLRDNILEKLNEQDYNGACCQFLESSEYLFKRAAKGKPYGKEDRETYFERLTDTNKIQFSPILAVVSGLVLGAFVAFLIVSKRRDKLVIYYNRDKSIKMAPKVNVEITNSKDIKH